MRSRNVLDIKKAAARRHAGMRELPLRPGIKPLRLKQRRLRRKIWVACICVMLGAGAVTGLGGVTHLEQFAVSDVSVSGAQKISPDAITTQVKNDLHERGFELLSRRNIFLYPKQSIESTLSANFPRLKEVSVARTSLLATVIVVTVKEREAYAKWCSSECYYMDSGGFIFAPLEVGAVSHAPRGAKPLTGFATSSGEIAVTHYVFRAGLLPNADIIGQTFLRGRLPDIAALLDGLSSSGFRPQGITIENEKDFTIPLERGPELRVSFDMDREVVMRNLETSLQADSLKDKFSSLQYIDLRFGNRVYYK